MMDRCENQFSAQEKASSFHLLRVMQLVCVIVFGLLLWSCAGGSGSSGFDISPSAENESINQALTTRQCLPDEALTICPANETALDVPVPGQTPPAEGVDVGTMIDSTDFGHCVAGVEPTCRIAVMISVVGLTPGAAYQIAARGFDPLSSWNIADVAVIVTDEERTTFPATIEVPAASLSIQVAVLVFVDGSGTTLGEILTLTETGADFAFVTAPTPLPR
jgi:hypothetical protein